MEDAIRQRIEQVFKVYKINPTRFSGEDTAMQKRLSRQLKGGAAITFETLSSILSKYPEVSSDWLLTGEGEMLKDKSASDFGSTSVSGNVSGGIVGNKVLNGNINGNGNNVGIIPADCERKLIRAEAEIDILKKKIKESEAKHKQDKDVLNKMLEQAILDKDKAMSMLEKALSR